MSKNFAMISTSAEIMGGTPVFIGTRVPVQTLFDYVEAGESIDDFLEGFPTVRLIGRLKSRLHKQSLPSETEEIQRAQAGFVCVDAVLTARSN